MKFFIIGGYTCGNPGDEAILKSTIYYLHERFPKSFFYIWNDNKDFTVQFDRSVRHRFVFWKLPRWMYLNNLLTKITVKLYTDLFPFSKTLISALNRPPVKLVHALRDSDKAIFLGGGYLNSYYSLLKMNFLASWIKAHNKPLLLFGQTLGPFVKATHARIASEIFSIAETIVLRDHHSEKEVVNFQEKVLYGVDDAVGFSPKLEARVQSVVDPYFKEDGPDVVHWGLNLRQWDDSRDYYPQIARAMESAARAFPEFRIKWLFLPMETSQYCDDRREAAELFRHLGKHCDLTVVREELSVEAKSYFLSRLDLFLGMRLHSLVFALNSGVPTIGLYHNEYYRRKICGVLKSFGVEACSLSLQETQSLPDLIARIMDTRDSYKTMILGNKSSIMDRQQRMLENVLQGSSA